MFAHVCACLFVACMFVIHVDGKLSHLFLGFPCLKLIMETGHPYFVASKGPPSKYGDSVLDYATDPFLHVVVQYMM